jgi:hypothetical protein
LHTASLGLALPGHNLPQDPNLREVAGQLMITPGKIKTGLILPKHLDSVPEMRDNQINPHQNNG